LQATACLSPDPIGGVLHSARCRRYLALRARQCADVSGEDEIDEAI
jgi:hypothetical protein